MMEPPAWIDVDRKMDLEKSHVFFWDMTGWEALLVYVV